MISYIGGKSRMAEWVSSYVPQDIETYVEVFGGAFWVYINSDIYKRVDKVIYNDFNPHMVNLFRCIRIPDKKFENFICDNQPPVQKVEDESSAIQTSRECLEYFNECKEILFGSDKEIEDKKNELKKYPVGKEVDKDKRKENTQKRREINKEIKEKKLKRDGGINKKIADFKKDINRDAAPKWEEAMRYAYIVCCSFSGIDPVYSKFQDYKGKYGSKFTALRNRLRSDKFIPKLESITCCENMSFERVIKKYNTSTTYFYCDPPYWNTEGYYSLHGFGEKQHEKLRNILKEIEGKFSLSYYDFPDLGKWYPEDEYKWERKEFVKAAGAKEGKKQSSGEEILIMKR